LCECGESKYQGYPCRHEMSICVHIIKDPQILHFEKRWRIDFFKPEEKKDTLSNEEEAKLNENESLNKENEEIDTDSKVKKNKLR